MPILAATPPMGWYSWNTFGREINGQIVRETAEVMIQEGVRDAGYLYVVIDDPWEKDERIYDHLTWDRKKFPIYKESFAARVAPHDVMLIKLTSLPQQKQKTGEE